MSKHRWLSRIATLLVIAVVVSCSWYVARNRSGSVLNVPAATTAVSAAPVAASAPKQALAATVPVVRQTPKQIQLSLDAVAYKHVQRVEFYIEHTFVGAAYTQPYTVSIDQGSLPAGNHTVSAKVYMAAATAQTAATSFTSSVPASSSGETPITADDQAAAPSQPSPPSSSSIVAPSNVTASSSDDGTVATISWSASTNAVSYQLWRYGSQIATVQSVTYQDTALNPGQTYDYQVVTVDAAGNTSELSDIAAVTMTTSPGAGPVKQQNVLAPDDTSQTDTSVAPTDTSDTDNQ